MKLKKISVIGGDKRFEVCSQLFASAGCECAVYALDFSSQNKTSTKSATLNDAVSSCDAVILPIPHTKNSYDIYTPLSDCKVPLDDMIAMLEDRTVIFTGDDGRSLKNRLITAGKHNEVISYTSLKKFAVMGGVPTAECAVSVAVKETEKTCKGSKYLITGFGNVGKQLAVLAKNIGADVFVTARKKEDLAMIQALGLKPLNTYEISDCVTSFDVIFNTIPALIFNKSVLMSLRGSPTIIELASKPYGADFNRIEKSR